MRVKYVLSYILAALYLSACNSPIEDDIESIKRDLYLEECVDLNLNYKNVETNEADFYVLFIFKTKGCWPSFGTASGQNGSWSYHEDIWSFTPSKKYVSSGRYYDAVFIKKLGLFIIQYYHD